MTEVGFDTWFVETVKFALIDPAGTVTLGGTPATNGLSQDRFTVRPPVGAAPVRSADPCAELPPTTLLGLTLIDDNVVALGTMVKEALTVPL